MRADVTFEFTSGGQILEMEGTQLVAQQHFSRPGRCRLRLFDLADDHSGMVDSGMVDSGTVDSGTVHSGIRDVRHVVLVTDLDEENPGMSVTNAAEDIASQVCLHYHLDPARTVFIEHYDDRFRGLWHGQLREKEARLGRENGESFDWVFFPGRQGWNFGEPEWKPASKAKVEALLHQKLSP
jgi:hypothetical protein